MFRIFLGLFLVLGLASCDGPPSPPMGKRVLDAQGISGGGVLVRGEDDLARWRTALNLLPARSPDEGILSRLDKVKSKVLVDDEDRVRGLSGDLDVAPMFEDGGPSGTWWEQDEQVVAEALRARGAEALLLRRDIAPSLDRNKGVLNRLYHDDHHPWFKLLAVDKHFLLYRVMEQPLSFPPELAALVARQIRAILNGEPVPKMEGMRSEDGKKWNLVASVRREGGLATAIGMCLRNTLQECIVELARDLEREHRRGPEILGFPPIAEEIDSLILEVHRVTERARVLSWDSEDLLGMWEMGIDGVVIIDSVVKRAAVFPGAVAYARAFRTPDRLLRHAASQFKLSAHRPWREPTSTLDKIRTIHYLEWPGKGMVELVRGVPVVPMEEVSIDVLAQSVVMGGEWYLENTDDKGFIRYKFWPSENRTSNEYNLVRHTLGAWNLVQAYMLDPRPEFLEEAKRVLGYTLQYRVDEEDRTFFKYNNNQKLGTVVVQLMGLIDLARASGSTEWDDLMIRMGNFTLFMQEDNGKFDPYYVPDDHPYADQDNDIVPGEALLALAMLYEYTGDEQWLAPVQKYFDYYIPWWNSRVTLRRDDMPWPSDHYTDQTRLDLVQFGPWTVMAANKVHKALGDERVAKFGLEVGRWMIENYQWREENSPWPDYVGGYYKMPNELPAMQAFCYAEGTAAAYSLARRFSSEEVPFFERATREAMRFALVMQYDEWSIYPLSRGYGVYGGTRYAMNETKVRVDYVHHALDSVFHYVLEARNDPDLPKHMYARLAEQPSIEVSEPSWVKEGVEPFWLETVAY